MRSRTTPWGMELTCEQCGRRETINPDRGEKETNEVLDLSKSNTQACIYTRSILLSLDIKKLISHEYLIGCTRQRAFAY